MFGIWHLASIYFFFNNSLNNIIMACCVLYTLSLYLLKMLMLARLYFFMLPYLARCGAVSSSMSACGTITNVTIFLNVNLIEAKIRF